MIAAVRTWLTAVAAVSLLLSVVQYITPKGTLRDTASFIGGLLLLLVLLQPVRKAALPDDVRMGLAEYEKQVETYRTKLEEERKKELGTLIESETEAYILDKAARMGLTVRIKVGTEENSEGVPVPVSAELTGTPSRELSRWIEAELGIPVERQVWLDEN